MSGLLMEIQRIMGELASDKATARNKAMELLDQKMNTSREALHGILSGNQDISWTQIFHAINAAIIKHTSNLQEAREKTYKTLSDKCFLYGNVLHKVIEYNLEVGRRNKCVHFLAKSTIFEVFENGIKQRTVVKHFGDQLLNMLERGIYMSPIYVCDLKVSEYSRVLSYLFELNVNNDEFLRSRVMQCIRKTVQLAQQRVQLHADLADYLPTLSSYALDEKNSDRRIEILRLYHLFLVELSVNYHQKLCIHMQEILPKLCDFYNDDTFREDTKNLLFECVSLSLRVMYPNLNSLDFGTFQVAMHASWPQTMQKLKTIIDMEIRKNSGGRNKFTQLLISDKFSENFIQMSALIMYIVLWHLETRNPSENTEQETPCSKRLKLDQIESLIKLIDKKETSFNDIWFAIFAELLQLSNCIINVSNYQQTLQITGDVLLIYGNGKTLRNVRLCLESLLQKEQELLHMSVDYLSSQWSQIVTHLISDTRSTADVVLEKQLILQALIRHNKLTPVNCSTLIQSIQSNELLRRNECIATIRDIFIHADNCGLNKASNELESIINWAYTLERSNATQIIHNIAAIDTKLLADTFAIGIINFLDEQQLRQLSNCNKQTAVDSNLQLLNYKYNKQLICLSAEYQLKLLPLHGNNAETDQDIKNCLFQNNYELLMRLLNLSASNEHNSTAIIRNLRCLHKLVCTMERLLHYKVFNAESLAQCPLIKRIGLFLSHIEFQYKAIRPECVNAIDLPEIVEQQMSVLDVFNSHELLLQYLEKQPIEMLIDFMGALLKQTCARPIDPIDSADRATMIRNTLHILGRLCANSSYLADAFRHIAANVKQPRHQSTEVLLVTKMMCSCSNLTPECIEWLVDKLKGIFQHLYTNVEVISQLVEYIPTIFYFVYNMEYLLDDMMMAMISLLKLALKKSYPTQLAVQIVSCVAEIAHRCPNIFELENFAVICMSVAKFLGMPTLEVRLATTSTLSLLLNTSYCVPENEEDAVNKSERHLEFCRQLYESIEWNKFLFIVGDLEQNSHAVAIQTLVAFFAFSSFHQEIVLERLLLYVVEHKLTETDFCAFSNIVPGHKLTMRQLMKPYADRMLNKFKSLHWPISKFPYYLCYNSKDAFLKDHGKSIMAYAYIYNKPEDIRRYSKFINVDGEEEEYLNILKAYLMIASSDEEFRQHYENLQQNLEEFQLQPMDVPLNALTLFYTIRLLLDHNELARLFNATVPCNRVPAWYNIGVETLFSALQMHLGNSCRWSRQNKPRLQAMSVLMFEQPLVLIDLLTILKTDCHEAVLPSHGLHCFFLYCSIADAVLDAAQQLQLNSSADVTLLHVNCAYFVLDVWFFVCRFLLHTKCGQLQRAGLEFLEIMQSKQSFAVHDNSTRNSNGLDEIAKLLMACAQRLETKKLRQHSFAILKAFIDSHREQLNMQILLEENADCEYLESPLIDVDLPKAGELNVVEYIREFLKPNRLDGRLHGLREYIADHKMELQQHDQLLFQLISRLIRIVRDSPKQESSMDALRCLAEIGPLKMQSNSYYFQTDFDAFDQSTEEPMDAFIRSLLETLDKQLFHFETRTQQALVQVAGHVVNSNSGAKLHVMHPNLRIFRHRKHNNWSSEFLNSFTGIPPIDWVGVLKSSDHLDYEPWMCAFMSRVFGACDWPGFDAFAANSFPFAKACLQPFVKLLLANRGVHLDGLCSMLDHFFNGFCQLTKGIYQEKRAIKQFLYICECIRLTNNWSIPINLSNAIMASNHCQAYFLSIMYLELWACEAKNRDTSNSSDILDDDNFQKSAKKAYESIGCLDAMSGFLNPLRARVDYLSLNNNLIGCWLESDNLNVPNSELSISIMKSNGMLSLANLLQQRRDCNEELDYEILWRLGQWDELAESQQKLNTSKDMEREFNKQHYLALKSITNREEENTVSAIRNAYHCVMGVLRDISVECLQSVYKYMTWLCTLQQAEDFTQIQFGIQLSTTEIDEIFNKWQTELELIYGNFNCKEHILSHQIALFKMAGTRANRRIQQYYKQNPVDTYLLKCIGVCKDAGKLNMANKYIAMLRGLPNLKEATKAAVLLEDADVHVKTGNYQIAKATLQHVVSNLEFQYCLQRVPALRMQGEFLLNCNAQSFSYTLDHNFNKSIRLLDQFELHKQTLMSKHSEIFVWSTFGAFVNDNRKAAHAAIAKYADREYQQLHNYRHSQEYKMLADIIQQNLELADTVSQRERTDRDRDRDRRVGAINLSRFAKLDAAELQKIEDNLTHNLCTAVEHYIEYCQLDGGASSAEIYRIIALWFTNDQNSKMLLKINDLIRNVPSYKFICALNQMVGRLTAKNADFHKVLVEVLVRCGQDHPQQTFYKLYPLVYAHMDGSHSNTQRADIAKKIIAQICRGNPAVATCNKQFDAMFPALIAFANTYLVKDPNGRPTAKGLPDKLKKLNTLKLDTIHCPTLSLSVQPSKQYNIISMVKWTNDFTLCGGLNAPIKMSCLCSDGVVRAQLIKGRDDLRQDAVMQQVFGIVNELLNSDSEFIERKLHLRTYKVTPLSMRSGILEWCSNTIPVSAYLVGANNCSGAHMKYHPNGWTNRKCRELSLAALRKSDSQRKAVYDKICENVKPVFHYFLLEKFLIPGVWFERRLAYINSVATTSMVGYVLGLGDRHTQNILIDEQTAEVVHIDFGIAFEQGKIQATKETVPFRLSRDFVAPMGFSGTNGVFTKSCEAIMHILRRYKPVFTTILEVLLYDPLFIWGVLSKDQSQESSKESKNLLAQRSLLLVQHKLEGRETGVLDNTSVESQVQRLINEATLPSNLALLYPGWDPYL
ncbi:hypothetical protein ACLKA7_005726 [Drosophila subpalustris]